MKICLKCNKTFSDEKMFCEFCGSNLVNMNQDKKANKSGVGKGAIIAIVVLSIVTAGSVIFNIYQYSEYGYYEERYYDKVAECNEMKNHTSPELQEEIDFYEKYVALVPDNGTKYYHIYGCEDFGDSVFWAFNINQAEDKGYQPCAKCHSVIEKKKN